MKEVLTTVECLVKEYAVKKGLRCCNIRT